MDYFKIDEPVAIAFSGGRTSAYMLWRFLQSNDGKIPKGSHVLFANTGKEHEETLKFVKKCSEEWGVDIVWLEYNCVDGKNSFDVVDFDSASRDGQPFERMIKKYKSLPNLLMRSCTGVLKIQTCEKYLKSVGFDGYNEGMISGIRFDEQRRAAKFERHRVPLVCEKITKSDVLNFWAKNSFDLNLTISGGETTLGNCDLCFNKKLSTLQSIIREEPSRVIWWARMEKEISEERGDNSRFNKTVPSYSEMEKFMNAQSSLFDESIPCFCGD